ncbi:MAG: hypothetical protein HY326_05500 [Chloroflexi bacterium]|nr:hypothetical protein [Chloroflexota bacterium]
MVKEDSGRFVTEEQNAELGRMFIEEYLAHRGLTWDTVCRLPEEEAKSIMTEASTYASIKLAEVEDRARFVHKLHGDA